MKTSDLEAYHVMYRQMFLSTTKALKSLREKQYADAELILMNAQKEAERIFIQWGEPPKA